MINDIGMGQIIRVNGEIMIYNNIQKAIFISRPNRFIANVETSVGEEVCHVKNTGRCKELLIPGATVYVERNFSESRKTSLDLISVEKNGIIVNIDSQAPNKAAFEWISGGGLFGGVDILKKEVTYKKSRIDLYAEKNGEKIFIEVKGVTLFEGNRALFPDAPTERGIKHLEHLADAAENGYSAYVLFVLQAKVAEVFSPNYVTHRAFGEALSEASRRGVKVTAVDCVCTPESMIVDEEIKVEL